MKSKCAYLCGKGRSLDNLKAEWFEDYPVWCLNQSADIMRRLLPKHEIHCVQNDGWINYVPPENVTWHCGLGVPVGSRHVERYCPERLTGVWNVPTCICALELMHREGIEEVTMVGFDSHFDGSREYAPSLNLKPDDVTDFGYYDTMIRRYACDKGMRLTWWDNHGCSHEERNQYKCCILGVAKGEAYERQTDGMIASFLKYNPTWTAQRYYGDRLEKCLPQACRGWTEFDKCEIGRWCAMRDLLDEYDTVVYADGDVRWYYTYLYTGHHELTLCPHYVTGRAMARARRQIFKDGKANIGIVEVNRASQRGELFRYIIDSVLKNPSEYRQHGTLWLQPLISSCADVGFDVYWNMYEGQDVAAWNLLKGDRRLVECDGNWSVECNGSYAVLESFHFSVKSLHKLADLGAGKLLKEYLDEK